MTATLLAWDRDGSSTVWFTADELAGFALMLGLMACGHYGVFA